MSDSQNKSTTSHSDATKRRKKKRRGNPILRGIIIVIIVLAFVVGGVTLGLFFGIAGSLDSLNTEDVMPESFTSFIYDYQGNEIDSLHGDENREYVKLESVPKDLQNAVIAIEDERFYKHGGIDIRGILRALVINVKNGEATQGASTITQQLIKNEAVGDEKSFKRKIKEQVLAIRFEKDLEKQFGSKDKAKDYILELYLNSIALNHGLNGVEAASKYYYGKDVSQLTLAESASIAGITKNPSLYSPISNPAKNKERQTVVLNKMKELKFITESQYNIAIAEDIYSKIVGNKVEDADESLASHSYFVDALIVQLAEDLMLQKKMNKSQAYDMIYSGGLKIQSTVNPETQGIMEDSYKNDALFPPKGNTLDVSYTISVMDNITKEQTHHTKTTTVKNEEEAEAFVASVRSEFLSSSVTEVADNKSITESLQSAMVILDYRTGEVKALVGGRGEKHGDLVFNRATKALRQPGSSMKPLVSYAPAIDLGLLMPGSILIDEPFSKGGYEPKNWNGRFLGACTVREAIRDSMNVLAVKTLEKVGVDKGVEYLKNFGITSLDDTNDRGLALALGGMTQGVSVLELTAAYGTIANGGLYNKPHFYTKVFDHNGKVLLENKPEEKRVIKETTAYMLTDMMKDVITGGGSATGRLANFKGMTIAGKTGTTNDDKDLTFAGYTPYYVSGIWMGYDNPKPLHYDKSYHLLLWRDIMEKVHKSLPDKDFTRPAGIENRSFCSASGKVPTGLCSNDYYGSGISSDLSSSDFGSATEACDYHKSYRVDISSGKIANEYCPDDKVSSIVLAVNPSTGMVINSSSDNDKVSINVSETCTTHSAQTKREEKTELIDEIPIGADYPIGGEPPVLPPETQQQPPVIPEVPVEGPPVETPAELPPIGTDVNANPEDFLYIPD